MRRAAAFAVFCAKDSLGRGLASHHFTSSFHRVRNCAYLMRLQGLDRPEAWPPLPLVDLFTASKRAGIMILRDILTVSVRWGDSSWFRSASNIASMGSQSQSSISNNMYNSMLLASAVSISCIDSFVRIQ